MAVRTLDAAKDVSQAASAAQDLIDSAMPDQIAVLTEEPPSYLASRKVPSAWLTAALAQKIPGLSDATDAANKAAKQYAVLAQNHSALTNAFAKDMTRHRC